MLNEQLESMTDNQLNALRSSLESEILSKKEDLRSVVALINDRLRKQQIIARYGAAGEVILQTMGVEEFLQRRAKLIAEGKLKEKGIVASVEPIETQLQIKPLKQ